jgi:hypothetical protein
MTDAGGVIRDFPFGRSGGIPSEEFSVDGDDRQSQCMPARAEHDEQRRAFCKLSLLRDVKVTRFGG